MSSFTDELKVKPLKNGVDWKLLKSFSYHVGSRNSKDVIKVPAGFVTDFASIPNFLITILGLVSLFLGNYLNIEWLFILGIISILSASIMPNSGKYGKAAVIHDYLYHAKERSRKMSDLIFLEAMEESNVNLVERTVMYRAVRWFGFLSWKKRK